MTEPPDRVDSTDEEDILLVDDQVESLRLLADILGTAGYRTRPVESPKWAVRSALAHPPALILLDVRMPEMDGFEVCRRLKEDERTRDVPVIFVSGLQDVPDRIRGFEVGGVDFVLKPIQEKEVLARVRTHLHLRRMQRDLERLVGERTRELQSAFEELRRSEDRFRATFEQAAVGIAHVALTGTYLRVNRKFCDILGYAPEELEERPFGDLTHPDDLEDIRQALRRLEDGDIDSVSMERRGCRKSGDPVWVNLTVSLRRDDAGAPWYFISTIQDISHRKRTETRLRSLASQLAIAEEQERRRISADLHDQAGQSLALARVQIAMARRSLADGTVTAALDEVSETLLRVNGELSNLIFDLRSPTLDEIGVAGAIREWLDEQIHGRHGIETEFVDRTERSGGEALSDEVRAVLFRNVREILTNVVKHAGAGKVRVVLERVESNLRIAVRDDGVGFDPGDASLVHGDAGGFGLFSIRERMLDLGGSLEIESAPGRGCDAVLTLPIEGGDVARPT